MPTRPAATFLLAFALFLLAACRGTVPIRDLLDDPGRYDGERVRVEGRVTGFSFGALGRGAFQVDDGTGTLPVVTQTGGSPREGARVGITATRMPSWRTSLAAAPVRWASARTSDATTAKPRPCSPARAASTAAFSARMLVWKATPSMTWMMSPMRRDESAISCMVS